MLNYLKKIFWFPISTKKDIEKYQTIIRDLEWDSFKKYIYKGDSFLDLGCGAGYYLMKAEDEFECNVYGVDPSPGEHGVGRFSNIANNQIIQGYAEKIAFDNEKFDVVLCSHVLEHVNDENTSLREINRVLKKDGILIIGMPTATMSIIAIISHYVFTTHINVLFFLQNLFNKNFIDRFIHIFIPASHSKPNHKYVYYDLKKYRVKSWRNIVNSQFEIIEELYPCLYPYPDYLQFFKPHKFKKYSSSIFFICRKK